MKRVRYRHVVLALLIVQLAVLGYIARVEYQLRALAALTYVELSGR